MENCHEKRDVDFVPKARKATSLFIEGGQRLQGEISISGAKNAVLPILSATLLTRGPVYLSNVPHLHDVATMLDLLRYMGVKTHQDQNETVVDSSELHQAEAPYALVKTMRASILTLGPLLARCGVARISLPGGCAIGARPVDLHLKGLRLMGAEINVQQGYIHARAQRLKGAHIVSEVITVTGTENLLMAAVLAEGETILENAACEPEVTDLAHLLVKMGAKIQGIGSHRLVISGVSKLNPVAYKVIPDRIETGTFLCAAAATRGDLLLHQTQPKIVHSLLEKLTQMGAAIECGVDWIRIKMAQRPRAVDFHTKAYPGFPTDMQAQFMVLNCLAEGSAKVVETIFENRFMHAQELNRFGAQIKIEGHTATIEGVESLFGARVMATDLRASASLVLAGLAAQGTTQIDRVYHLDRGYEAMEHKLSAVGANIYRRFF